MDVSDQANTKRLIESAVDFKNFNIKNLNRNIADYFLEKKSYKIFNNFS